MKHLGLFGIVLLACYSVAVAQQASDAPAKANSGNNQNANQQVKPKSRSATNRTSKNRASKNPTVATDPLSNSGQAAGLAASPNNTQNPAYGAGQQAGVPLGLPGPPHIPNAGPGVLATKGSNSIFGAVGFTHSYGPTSFGVVDAKLLTKFGQAKDDKEREAVEKEIHSELSKQFDKQIEKEEKQLADLQSRIDRIATRLKNRKAGKSALLDVRLQQLLDQADRRFASNLNFSKSGNNARAVPSLRYGVPASVKWPKYTPPKPSGFGVPLTTAPAGLTNSRPKLASSTTPVKPGDELLIENRSNETLSRRVTVLADHTIQVPMLGFVTVKGMSTSEVQAKLNAEGKKYFANPGFEVFLSGVSEPLTP